MNTNFRELNERISQWTADDEDLVNYIINIASEEIKKLF
jgi:hypothetical protein